MVDPSRRVALDVLRAVRERDAYANLVLPDLLRERRIVGRDVVSERVAAGVGGASVATRCPSRCTQEMIIHLTAFSMQSLFRMRPRRE